MKENPDDAIHTTLEKLVKAFALLSASAVGIVNQQVVPVRLGAALCAPFEGGIERIGDVGHNAGNRFRFLRAQGLGCSVWNVAEGLGDSRDRSLGRSRDGPIRSSA